MSTRIIFILFILMILFSCSPHEANLTPKESPELIEFRRNKAIWESRKISSYSVENVKICFCIDAGRYKVIVKNNLIESAFNLDTKQFLESKSLQGLKTIDELYTFIETTLKLKPYFSLIEYDKEGIPTRVRFDINERIADDEIEFAYAGFIAPK